MVGVSIMIYGLILLLIILVVNKISNKSLKLILFAYIILCIIFFVWYNYDNVELFNDTLVLFPDKDYVQKILNQTDYFKNLTQADLIARHHKGTSKTYKQLYLNSIAPFTGIEMTHLTRVINRLNNEFYKIQWKLVKIKDNVENGFPHTFGDIIVLPEHTIYRNDIDKILLHEKFHVYQRLYEKEYEEKYLYSLGYKKIDCNNIKIINQRSNPDIKNCYAYTKSGKNDIITYAQYNSTNPKDLNDIHIEYIHIFANNTEKNSDPILDNKILSSEHPNELTAKLYADDMI